MAVCLAETTKDDKCSECAPSRDLRESPRFRFATAVMFENYLSGSYYHGRMMDYSRGGMSFETSATPSVGTEIFIGMDESPYSSAHEVFRAKVVWLRELPLERSHYAYAVGVKYC